LKKGWDNSNLFQPLFILAVADCIENALQIKLFSMLVILAGVGRRNHFLKIRFLSHSIFYSKPFSYGQ
ncbi:hypothetical protein, partial [Staphylococcus arlettae]|uniref:hypothetical protein n=1 Tax=Staphylococcus arlettae TaxID=29378 RepID=UPI0019602B65